MSQITAAILGGMAGLTIFIGLPVARLRGLSRPLQGFLNALATGILLFLLWDILSHASGPVDEALMVAHKGGGAGGFTLLVVIFAAGIAAGLLSLVYFNGAVLKRLRPSSEAV